MLDLLTLAYPWTKALHIISMTAWMAGLFYLPRLFVYHAERAGEGSELSETLKIMEEKLLRLIMNPAMIATWLFGILLLGTPGIVDWTRDLWIYPKLAAIGAITWLHHWLGLRRKEFLRDANTRTGRSYRLMNEVPTVALLIIVVMVIVRPF
jgi:protoporphyrinogen IX oxidase